MTAVPVLSIMYTNKDSNLISDLKTNTAEEVIQAYIDHVYSRFGGSLKILSDNGTEFKNKV